MQPKMHLDYQILTKPWYNANAKQISSADRQEQDLEYVQRRQVANRKQR